MQQVQIETNNFLTAKKFSFHSCKTNMEKSTDFFWVPELTSLYVPPLRAMRRSCQAASRSPRVRTTTSWCHGWALVSLPALATSGTPGGRCWLQHSISGEFFYLEISSNVLKFETLLGSWRTSLMWWIHIVINSVTAFWSHWQKVVKNSMFSQL